MSGVADFGGSEVAEAFVEIHADTDALDGEVDRAATHAAKEASKTAPPIKYGAEVPSDKVVAAAKKAARAAKDAATVSYGAEVSATGLRRAAREAAAAAREAVSVNFGAKILTTSLLVAMRKAAAEANGRVSVTFGAKVSGGALTRAIKAASAEAKGIEISIPVSAAGTGVGAKDAAAARKAAQDAAKALETEQKSVIRNATVASAWARRVSAEVRSTTKLRQAGLAGLKAEGEAIEEVGRKAVVGASRVTEFVKSFRIKKNRGTFQGALDIDNPLEALKSAMFASRGLARFLQGGLTKALSVPVKGLEAIGKLASVAGQGLETLGEGMVTAAGEASQFGGIIAKFGGGLARLGALAGRAAGAMGPLIGGIAGLAAAMGAIQIAGSTLVWIAGMATNVAALATALGTGVAGGLIAFAGGLTAVGVAAATIGIGFNGVGTALTAYNKAQDAVAAGAKPTKKQLAAINASLAGLAPNAKTAVVAMSSFQDQWKAVVQQPVQQALFTGWADSITEISQKLLPTLGKGLAGIALTVSDIGNAFADWATRSSTVKQISTILAGLRPILQGVATVIGGVGQGLINLFQGALPFINQVIAGAGRAAQAFADWTAKISGNGALADFLGRAKADLGLLVGIAKNVGRALGGLFGPLEEAGRGFLGTIEDLTGKFADWINSASGQNSIAQFINDGKMAAQDLKGVIQLIAPILSTIWRSFRLTFENLSGIFRALYPFLHIIANALAAIGDAALVAGEALSLLGHPLDLITGKADLSGLKDSLEQVKQDVINTFSWETLGEKPVTVAPGEVTLAPGSAKGVKDEANRQLQAGVNAQPPGKPVTVNQPPLKFNTPQGDPLPAKDQKEIQAKIDKAVKAAQARLKAAADKALAKWNKQHPIGQGGDPWVMGEPTVVPPDPAKLAAKVKAAIEKGLSAGKGKAGAGGDLFLNGPDVTYNPNVKVEPSAKEKAAQALKDALSPSGKSGSGGDPWLSPDVTLDPKWFVVPQATGDAQLAIQNAIAGGQWPFTHPTIINADWSTPPTTQSNAKQIVQAALVGSAWPYTHSTIINADWSTPRDTGSAAKQVVQASLNGEKWSFSKTATVNVSFVVNKPKKGAVQQAVSSSGGGSVVVPVSTLTAARTGVAAPQAAAPMASTRATESSSISRDIGQAVGSAVSGLTAGGTTTIEVNLPTGDPEAAAMAVMNRMAGRLAT